MTLLKVGDSHNGKALPFKFKQLPRRGWGVVATRKLAPNEEIFQDEALGTVRTIMILSGVIVKRRSPVEKLYDAFAPEQQFAYRSLHPCSVGDGVPGVRSDMPPGIQEVDNHANSRQGSNQIKIDAPIEHQPSADDLAAAGPITLRGDQHRNIWDMNGFHYCTFADVRFNNVLHHYCFPAFLSIVTGSLWAGFFQGQYTRSILSACVLFFTIGPISARIVYLGSQGLFLKASRVNHSCQPNATWEISGALPILHPLRGSAAEECCEVSTSSPRRVFTLRTQRAVAAGEEITIDYIADLAHMDAIERRKLLKTEFGFVCDCKQCVEAERKAPKHEKCEAEEVW